MTPQFYDTKCLICQTRAYSPVEHYVCNDCHNSYVSTVADFIIKQAARIAALEAQIERLVKSLDDVCWAVEKGDFSADSVGMTYCKNARDLLFEFSDTYPSLI